MKWNFAQTEVSSQQLPIGHPETITFQQENKTKKQQIGASYYGNVTQTFCFIFNPVSHCSSSKNDTVVLYNLLFTTTDLHYMVRLLE